MAYTHHAVMEGDLIFSLPDTAMGLLYRPTSPTQLRYVGWALPEAALDALDAFWVSDSGIDESTKFLNRMGQYHELSGVKITGDTFTMGIEVCVWDILFLMACSPRGWYEAEEQKERRGKPSLWWGKAMPLAVRASPEGDEGGDVRRVEFKEPDKQFERRQRSLRY